MISSYVVFIPRNESRAMVKNVENDYVEKSGPPSLQRQRMMADLKATVRPWLV